MGALGRGGSGRSGPARDPGTRSIEHSNLTQRGITMSRAYRIAVRESIKRVVRARDHVSTDLEILGILAKEQMAELLAQELKKQGFKQKGKNLVRSKDGVSV